MSKQTVFRGSLIATEFKSTNFVILKRSLKPSCLIVSAVHDKKKALRVTSIEGKAQLNVKLKIFLPVIVLLIY